MPLWLPLTNVADWINYLSKMEETHNSKYDYNPETDDVNSTLKWLLIIVSLGFAIYVSYIVV